MERDSYEKQDTLEQLQKQLEDTRSINQRLFEEIREKNDREKERVRKLEESKMAINALRSENENIYEEHERLKTQVHAHCLNIWLAYLKHMKITRNFLKLTVFNDSFLKQAF